MAPDRLLATDLDGTFIGDARAMEALWEELERHGITLAFSTGRHLPSIHEFYAAVATSRRAEACICMVGTEIWHLDGREYRRDEEWSRQISLDWDKAGVERILESIPEITMQDAEWQSPLKSSYFLEDNASERLRQLREHLDKAGLQAKVVYSKGRYLDVLPRRSGKGGAVAHLARSLGIPATGVVTAGDTGNDLDMMRPELGFRSVAVGNAAPELRAYRTEALYHAAAPYAAGIREGLVEFGWLPG